jgi:hypothetical protein
MRRRDGGTDRGQAPEMRRLSPGGRHRAKSRSRPMRRPRACLASTHSGGAGAPPGGTMAPCQELADGTGLSPSCRWRRDPPPLRDAAIAGGRNSGTVQKARPGAGCENAAVERREAPLSRQGERPNTDGAPLGAPPPLHPEGKGNFSPARGNTRAHPAPTQQHGQRSVGYLAMRTTDAV